MSSLNSLLKKRNLLIFLFLIIVIVLVTLVISIFLVDNKFTKTQNEKNETAIALSELTSKLDKIATDEEKQDSEYQKAKNLFSKSLSSKDKDEQYTNYLSGVIKVQLIYSLYHNNNLYSYINQDLADYTKKYFPKQYDENYFGYPCQDPKCADSKQPEEILAIIDELKTSDMKAYYKENFIANLLNTSYESSKYPHSKASQYYSTANSIEISSDVTPSGVNVEIAKKLKDFIKKTYPEDYKLFIKLEQNISPSPQETEINQENSGL